MNIYIFENVLSDYTAGMAVIAAESLIQAQELAHREFGWTASSVEDFVQRNSGWQEAASTFAVTGNVKAGILHHVYGGG